MLGLYACFDFRIVQPGSVVVIRYECCSGRRLCSWTRLGSRTSAWRSSSSNGVDAAHLQRDDLSRHD